MGEMCKTFYRAEDVLNWLNSNNPARAKYGHRIEKISGERVDTSFDWGYAMGATQKVLKRYNDYPAKRVAFEMHFIACDREFLIPVDIIARRLGRSQKQIHGFLNEIMDELEVEFRARDIVIAEP